MALLSNQMVRVVLLMKKLTNWSRRSCPRSRTRLQEQVSIISFAYFTFQPSTFNTWFLVPAQYESRSLALIEQILKRLRDFSADLQTAATSSSEYQCRFVGEVDVTRRSTLQSPLAPVASTPISEDDLKENFKFWISWPCSLHVKRVK